MNVLLNYKDVGPASHKRDRHSAKPFWTNELSVLWGTVKKSGKIFIQSKKQRKRKNQLLNFPHNQHLFDREFRKAKRKYNRKIQCNIEILHSNRPTEFWEEVNKLGPTKKDNIPLEVYNEQNEIINDIPSVLGKWENDFKVLYNFESKDAGFKETFYNDILLRKQNLENRVSGAKVLNKEFTNIEITKVLTKSKLEKSCRTIYQTRFWNGRNQFLF